MFQIKVREEGATAWELETVPNGVSYGIIDQNKSEGRTMDDTAHKLKTSQKVKLTLTFNNNLTVDVVHDLLHAFSHRYLEVMYFDMWDKAQTVRSFTVGERSTVIAAWNDNYKRFAPITIELEER